MKPTVGRILFYTYTKDDVCHSHAVGQQRPCIVVRTWPNEFGEGVDGYNVQVITDGRNDFEDGRTVHWKTSVRLNLDEQSKEPGQISWPLRA